MTSYVPVKLGCNFIEPEKCDKEKAPVIFLHGLGGYKEHWEDIPQIVADATKRKVYALDARNHGDSEWTDEFSLDSNEYDLVNFMDSINAPKAILVGHSMGGITSMKTALHQPERVQKLIVEDISVRVLSPESLSTITHVVSLTKTALQQVPPDVDENTAYEIMAEYALKNFPKEILEKYNISNKASALPRVPLKRAADGSFTFKTNFDQIVKFLTQSKKLMDEFEGIYKGPAYFIYGKASPFLVGNDEDLIKSFFPKAELIGIENAAHSVHTECSKEFVDHLLKCILN